MIYHLRLFESDYVDYFTLILFKINRGILLVHHLESDFLGSVALAVDLKKSTRKRIGDQPPTQQHRLRSLSLGAGATGTPQSNLPVACQHGSRRASVRDRTRILLRNQMPGAAAHRFLQPSRMQ